MEAPRPKTNESPAIPPVPTQAAPASGTPTNASSAIPEEKASLLSNKDEVFDVGSAEKDRVGTIVSDKKRTRQSFLGVIKDAASEWTEDNTETVKSLEVFQKPEIPKVAPGTERKEIIEKAVMTPQAEVHDDHKVVMEHIKTLKLDAERVTGKPFIIKKEANKTPMWSHIIGGDAKSEKALPSSGKSFPQVQHIHREDVTSKADSQPVAPIITERSQFETEEGGRQESSPTPNVETIASQPKPAPRKEVVVPQVPQAAAPAHKAPQQETGAERWAAPRDTEVARIPKDKATPTARPKVAPGPSLRQGLPVFGIATAVLVLVLVGGIGAGAYYFLNREPVVAGVTVPAFIDADTRASLPLVNSREELLQSLKGALDGKSGEFIHLYLIFEKTAVGSETLATTGDFFGVLAPRVGGAFIRSLDERMMLGGVQTGTTQPYMLLKSNAFDTAFAGMLEWETFMSADLAPFFGDPVSRSFDPDARSDDRTVRLAFADRTIANHNVRTLYDESGNERITYGFVNRNTIILTTSAAAFEKLLGALQ